MSVPVLDGQIRGADVEAVCVVPSRLTVAVRIGLIAQSCGAPVVR